VTGRTTPVAALLDTLPPTTFVVGKGGVGKTTCAAALALEFAARGDSTLLVSTDPAAALGLVLGAAVGPEDAPVPGATRLRARQLSADALRAEFLAAWGDVITEIVDRGTYLDREDIAGLVETAFPGADELFAFLALAELVQRRDGERIVVDTAPTGHTLRLLQLPATWNALVALMDAMQEKHRFMVRALTHRYRADRADAFLSEMRTRIEAFGAALTAPARTAVVLVTRQDPVVEAESTRFAASLREMRLRIAGVLLDAVGSADAASAPAFAGDAFVYALPRADPPPRGVTGLRDLLRTAQRVSGAAHASSEPASRGPSSSRGDVDVETLARALTIVGGKGGVGKTSVACALALSIARPDRQVLLVSTDPAPSIADALGERHASWRSFSQDVAVPGAPGLVVRQMDAAAAFARVRDQYQRQVDTVFDAIMARGIDAAADRAIVRDLLALAPPGIDEVYALAVLGDTLAADAFARVIVDPAPTGHLLRLLEMPALAIEWSHRLLRLMLKYKDVTGLGDAAAELLAFSKRTRALQSLLSDRERAGMLLVALDEPVVRAETERLAAETRARGVTLLGVVWNRVFSTPVALPSAVVERQFCAPAIAPPPIGIDALREWADQWRSISSIE